MHYPRYFKLGQNLSLTRIFLDPAKKDQLDTLSGQIASCTDSEFIVHFPYRTSMDQASYPFFPGMPFEIHSEYHGIGVQVSVSFENRLSPGLVLLLPAGDLKFYYLQEHARIPTLAWIGISRMTESLLSLRRKWRRQTDMFRSGNNIPSMTAFAKQDIELGDDGLNMELESPIKTSELALIYLALDDGKPLICILAEIVHVEGKSSNKRQRTGLHFINIMEEDQVRIKKFLRTHARN